jgi:hypothetical protein
MTDREIIEPIDNLIKMGLIEQYELDGEICYRLTSNGENCFVNHELDQNMVTGRVR